MGHEGMGVIAEIGNAVDALNVGDYVVIPDIMESGHYELEPVAGVSPGSGPDFGHEGGCQSEYVRVPHAETNLIPVPLTSNTTNGTIDSSVLIDYLFVSDIFGTGWLSLDFAGFEAGDTVAVFGAGPVGLLAAYSAQLRGASRIYVVDHVQSRLDMAASIGAVPINFRESDPVQQILAHEPNGVRRSVDCVGYESLNADLEIDRSIVVRNMVAVTGFQGGMGQVGAWFAGDNTTGAPLAGTVVGQAHPSFIVSSEINIEQAPEYYSRFNDFLETKVVITFP
ncbi:putative alcohol dehydrogenase protein [Neofusicoccum parvum UCRNP2]|uniref:Putative alcohol dehydrogenase protein n=1 Tax=Botryosphaeria parva (strain UCR-NP2) TaxID=1287680 RepID=R1GIY8_BOTPV|nr:putative alcohol dehydrogenase protein [Neofusicoccum parvum UCRNP2]